LATLRRDWVIAFVLGELVGFLPPAATGAALAAAGASDLALTAGLVVAGSLEGLALGLAQGWVLHRRVPQLSRSRWTLATSGAAALAWLAGMGGSAAVQAFGPPALLVAGPGVVAGLLAMGTLQWLVLRGPVPHSARWVPVTSLAWLVGVMIPVAALSAVPNGWPAALHAVVGVVAAIAMGTVVGALTGTTLVRLLAAPGAPRDAVRPA
jgi:hypothetical protein